ncbi:hypothetical protein WN943_026988 [Citrus x changshan-huyou]
MATSVTTETVNGDLCELPPDLGKSPGPWKRSKEDGFTRKNNRLTLAHEVAGLARADTTELVEEKETPATKHSRPQKRRPNTARLSRTRLKRRRAPSKFTTLPTNGL